MSLTLVAEACLSCPPAQLSSTLIAQRLSSSEDGMSVFVVSFQPPAECLFYFVSLYSSSVPSTEGKRQEGMASRAVETSLACKP